MNSISGVDTPARPTNEARAAAWEVIERDARYNHAGSAMSWRCHLAYQMACREAFETEQALLGYLKDAVEAKEITSSDELRERLEQDADSAFIYTLSALVYVLGCQNEGAYEDETGEKPSSVEAHACFAVIRNVTEEQEYQDMVEALDNPEEEDEGSAEA